MIVQPEISPDPLDNRSDAHIQISPRLFFHSLTSLGFVSFAALAFNFILARLLRVEDVGHIRVIRTVLDFSAIPASLGMSACLARHVSHLGVTEDARRRMLATGIALALTCGSLLSIVAFALFHIPDLLQDRVALGMLKGMIFLLPAMAVSAGLRGYLQGSGRIRALALAQSARSGALLFIGPGFILAWQFGGWAATIVLSEIVALAVAFKGVGVRSLPAPDRSLLGPFAAFGGYAALSQTVYALIGTLDVLCLDHFRRNPAEIAQYGIAMLMFTTGLLLPNAFLQSHFSRMAAHVNDLPKMRGLLLQYSRNVLMMALPAALAGWLAAPLVGLILGPAYHPSVGIFRWLLPAFVIQSLGIVLGNFLVAIGAMRAQLLIITLAAVLNFLLNIALIPRQGVWGAVAATTISYAVLLACSIAVFYLHRPAARINHA